MKTFRLMQIAIAITALFAGAASAADPAGINWGKIPTKTLSLFYPARSTYRWPRRPEHRGARVVRGGGACLPCHKDAEEKFGNKLVKANKLEPTPVDGKNGVVKLNVQVAYDNENAYFRAQWIVAGSAARTGPVNNAVMPIAICTSLNVFMISPLFCAGA